MRVLQLLTRLNVGGPARQVLATSRSLGEGFEVIVAAGRAPVSEGTLTDPRVPVIDVPLTRPVRPGADASAYRAVKRLLRTQRPDLLHTHMAKAGAIGRIAAASQRPRPVTVHTFHGHVLAGYFSPSVQRGFVAAERRLARRTDLLVAVSTEIRDELLELRIGRPDQYEVIPVGVDLDLFARPRARGALRHELGLDTEVPLVGIVARLAPIKDHETLLAALAGLPGVHVAVLGDGELRRHLEQRASELGLRPRVHFTGWWHDMPAALADLDVVALSSRNEGTPYCLVEAAAAGRAVVATDVGGVRSVVEDGRTGFLVPPGDPRGLAERIRRLLADDRLRRRMGVAGQAMAHDRFGEASAARRLGDAYRSLVEGR